MIPCPKNRELLALLAVGALDTRHELELRPHLNTCAACQRYLEEISSVAGKLRAAEPERTAQASALFHRKVVAAVANAESRSSLETLLAQICTFWNWRTAVSGAAVVAALIAAWGIARPQGSLPSHTPLANRTVATPRLKADLAPTFSNYEMAAHQSLDKLDELLTAQANRNSARVPIYTTSLLTRLNNAD